MDRTRQIWPKLVGVRFWSNNPPTDLSESVYGGRNPPSSVTSLKSDDFWIGPVGLGVWVGQALRKEHYFSIFWKYLKICRCQINYPESLTILSYTLVILLLLAKYQKKKIETNNYLLISSLNIFNCMQNIYKKKKKITWIKKQRKYIITKF